jgi:hypothetical protein
MAVMIGSASLLVQPMGCETSHELGSRRCYFLTGECRATMYFK